MHFESWEKWEKTNVLIFKKKTLIFISIFNSRKAQVIQVPGHHGKPFWRGVHLGSDMIRHDPTYTVPEFHRIPLSSSSSLDGLFTIVCKSKDQSSLTSSVGAQPWSAALKPGPWWPPKDLTSGHDNILILDHFRSSLDPILKKSQKPSRSSKLPHPNCPNSHPTPIQLPHPIPKSQHSPLFMAQSSAQHRFATRSLSALASRSCWTCSAEPRPAAHLGWWMLDLVDKSWEFPEFAKNHGNSPELKGMWNGGILECKTPRPTIYSDKSFMDWRIS